MKNAHDMPRPWSRPRLACGRPRYRALWDWVRTLRGTFPRPPDPGEWLADFHDDHPPVDLYPVGRPETVKAWRMAIARACIAVAQDALAARPADLAHVRVAAAIVWPQAESSRVTFFFDPDYFARFELRDHEYDRWVPLEPGRSLLRELQIADPRLRERGYLDCSVDPSFDPPQVGADEIWMIGD